jgi:hypothetical protein
MTGVSMVMAFFSQNPYQLEAHLQTLMALIEYAVAY